jgi:hypothetical protein
MKLNLFLLSAAAAVNAAAAREAPVGLLSAKNYVILAKSGISTVPDSSITGDIAVSPIASTAITGFSLTLDSSGEFSTSTQVDGDAFAASYAAPTPAILTSAVGDMEAAYTDAAGRPNDDAARINLGGGILGGDFGGVDNELTPGVYTFATDVTISDTVYFRGSGYRRGQGDSDVFIIQVTGNLLIDAGFNVELTNGALASNIIWQIAGNVNVMAGSHLEGILLVKTDVTFVTGSSLNGRVLSQTACNLQMATITEPPQRRLRRTESARLDVEGSAGAALGTSFLGLFAMIFAMAF